jgi:arsenate reductase (thioredoxin)
MKINNKISEYLSIWQDEISEIPADRRNLIEKLADYVATHEEGPADLVFICTHNSRRSHLSQVWAQVAAHFCGVGDRIRTFSGGTEATALNINAIRALEAAGFMVSIPEGNNPRVELQFAEDAPPLICFSKAFDHAENPSTNFAAIMTCSDADENCPFIPGAAARIPLRYEDPKASDGSGREAEVYFGRSKQIAVEMLCLAGLVAGSK